MSLAMNPFRNRRPVTDPSKFYGRCNDLLFLAEKINDGQMCAISGEPLVGKTSLLYYLIHPRGAKSQADFAQYLGDHDQYLFVLLELGRLPMYNAQAVLRYLFDRIVEEAEKSTAPKEEYGSSSYDDYRVQRAFEHYLKNLKRRVVVLFDDFDIVIKRFSKVEATKVMQQLRAFVQAFDLEGKLNCIFVSVEPFDRLLNVHGFSHDSPLSSMITECLSLKPLSEREIECYIKGPLREDTIFSEPEIKFIKRLAGHHPAMVKIVCFHMFEIRFQKKRPATLSAIQETVEKDPGMLWLMETLWQRVGQAEAQESLPLKDGLVKLTREPLLKSRENEKVLEHLHSRGLIDCDVADSWILGSLFSDFIQHKNAEARLLLLSGEPDLQNAWELLAPLEYKLYRYLVENSERTCSRAELEGAIWGNKLPTSRDALEQLVKRVREKIEPHPEYPEYLLTVRGTGYLLRMRKKG